MMLIDTHCHLDDPRLSVRLSEVLTAADTCSVSRIIVPGIEPRSWERILALCKIYDGIFAAPGVHPMKADFWDSDAAKGLLRLIPDIVAIGEIGLDYSPRMPPRELQKEVFRVQLRIAREARLPVIVHCRRAFADTLQILADERIEDFGGVMHAFSGSLEIARECISLGLMIGVCGSVTWKNAVRPLQVVKAIPLGHLLLETDAPDMSPFSRRGMVNEPAFLPEIALRISEVKGVPVEAVAHATTENARKLFGLKRQIVAA